MYLKRSRDMHIILYNKSKYSNLRVSMKTELHSGERDRANLCTVRYVYRLSAEYGIIPGGLVGS